MATSLTCTGIDRSGGKVYVRWSDGEENEFDSVASARLYVRTQFEDVPAVRQFLRAIAIAKALNAANDGSQLNSIVGHTLTLDLSLASNLVRIT